MREALDAALKVSVDGNDLWKALREQGYELDANPAHKYATLRRIGSKKAVRLYRLGGGYDLPQTVVAFLTHGPKFFYFSLFSVDKAQYIFRCVQLFPANQLRLSADSVQTAAFLPQLRG